MKCLLKIIAAIVVLLIVVALVIPMFISADYLKGQLVAQVKQATGRTLEIKGKATLSVFPSIAVNVEDVTFGNPAGFASPYFTHIGSLQVGAALGPLLHRELLITGITLDGATLDLEQNAGGATNWDFATPTADKPATKTSAAPSETAGSGKLVINQVTIKNAAVNYHKFGASPMQFALSAVDATVKMSGQNVDITLDNASLYGGAIKGTAQHGGDDSIAVDMALSGVGIEPLMTALTGGSQVKGTANVSVKVAGKGANEQALMSSLNGGGDVKITDGAIKGINLVDFLRHATPSFILGNATGEMTEFKTLSASYKITNGVLNNDDLLMQSPVLSLTGKGTVNLVQHSINYRAVPSVAGAVGIPLNVTGPWSAISVQPDVVGMVQGVLKEPGALKQNLQNIKIGNPKDIGSALFGK